MYCSAETVACATDADCVAIIECYAMQGCTMAGCPACNSVIAAHAGGIAKAAAFAMCYGMSCVNMCADASTD
jgi:hypothetical protein